MMTSQGGKEEEKQKEEGEEEEKKNLKAIFPKGMNKISQNKQFAAVLFRI